MVPDQNNAKERMIKGCQVVMPETIFFKKGKIDYIVQCDREWCLTQDVKTLPNFTKAFKFKLPPIIDERRKDCTYLGITKAATRPGENKPQKKGKEDNKQDFLSVKENTAAKFMPYVILRFIDKDCTDQIDEASDELNVPGHLVICKAPFENVFSAKHSQIFQKIAFL